MSENNNYTAVLPKLIDETNFSTWKFRLKLVLEERGLEATLCKGDGTQKVEKHKDAKARSVIAQCVSDKYIEIIKKCESAAEMISKLEQVFERKSVFNQLYLRKKLLALKCASHEKLSNHFLKFDNLIASLESTGASITNTDRVCHLLLTLPSEYDTVITTLETIDKELNLDFVKSRLLDAELKVKENSKSQENTSTDTQSFLTCYKCGKHGHKVAECWSGTGRDTHHRGRFPMRSQRGRFRTRGRGNSSQGRTAGYFRTPWQSGKSAEATENEGQMSFTVFSANMKSISVSKSVNLVVDSGATEHLIMDQYEQFMTNIVNLEHEMKIYVANGQYLTCKKKGILTVQYNGDTSIDIEGLIVPKLSHNLLSVRKLLEKGLQVQFCNESVIIKNSKKIVQGHLKVRLYVIDVKLNNETSLLSSDLWHQRLGHANRNQLRLLQLPYSKTPCEPCMKGKSTRLPFYPTRKPRSHCIGELIHTDISGPMRTPTLNGEIYYHTIIDDFSHFSEVYLLKNKYEATDKLIEYIRKIETQTGNKVKKIKSDNGGEFKNAKILNFCSEKGIILQYTNPYSPQSNGVAERMNRTIYNRARTLLIDSRLPKVLWGEAVKCAVYQINRCPSSAINFQTPAEKMIGNKDLTRLRVFGSKVWAHILPKQDKLLERAREMRFVGYQQNGYRLWNPENNKISVSRDVRFDETQIQYKEKGSEEYDYENRVRCYEEQKEESEENKSIKKSTEIEENINKRRMKETKCIEETKKDQEDKEKGEDIMDSESSDYEDTEDGIPVENVEMKTRSGRVIKKPQRFLEKYDEINTAYCLLSGDPLHYEEALNKGWKNEINKELKAHEKMGTWEIADLPERMKAIDTKWIFRTKQDGKRKARLVAKGFQQNNSENNYSPVARISTIRMMMSLAVQQKLPLKQFDVPTAFLNGNLDVDIYIKSPEGLKIGKGKVLKLKRALYGLKEAPRCWNERFHDFIVKEGFMQSKHDSCLYGNGKVWFLLYVDDILYLGEDGSIIKQMEKEFNLKNLGEVKNYLGLEVTRKGDEMKIKQTEMIRKLLEKFNMQDSKGNKTPMETNFNSTPSSNIVEVPYKELIGSLLYISTNTRPDITYAVSYLSRFLDKPTQELWTAGKRVLRYLKETQEQGLLYRTGEYTNLRVFSDADWASDKLDRKSTSGCAVYQGNNLITWFSRKQTCIALSTAEAEYIAGAHALSELIHLKGLLSEVTRDDISAHIFIDNQSTIKLIQNRINTKASKHISIKYHYIKDVINRKIVSMSYVPTDENISDIFTKALPAHKHLYFCNKLTLQV